MKLGACNDGRPHPRKPGTEVGAGGQTGDVAEGGAGVREPVRAKEEQPPSEEEARGYTVSQVFVLMPWCPCVRKGKQAARRARGRGGEESTAPETSVGHAHMQAGGEEEDEMDSPLLVRKDRGRSGDGALLLSGKGRMRIQWCERRTI